MFYEIKIKVSRPNDKGEEKEVTERYITECELHAEAEQKGLELYNGECDVVAVKRSSIIEIVNQKEEEKPFYKATIISTFTNDDGSEKETKYQTLVCAKDVKEATELMLNHLKQGMDDLKLEGITKTNILDLI